MQKDFKKITDFIYAKPDVVVAVLNDSGYNISVKKATLHDITSATFTALSNNDQNFANKLANALDNEGELNIVPLVGVGIAVVSSVISGVMAKKEGKRNRELQKQLFLADQAFNEKLFYEQLQMQAETDRTNILVNSMAQYRTDLQKESTKRLRDTWIYVAFIGFGMTMLYGVYALTQKD